MNEEFINKTKKKKNYRLVSLFKNERESKIYEWTFIVWPAKHLNNEREVQEKFNEELKKVIESALEKFNNYDGIGVLVDHKEEVVEGKVSCVFEWMSGVDMLCEMNQYDEAIEAGDGKNLLATIKEKYSFKFRIKGFKITPSRI